MKRTAGIVLAVLLIAGCIFAAGCTSTQDPIADLGGGTWMNIKMITDDAESMDLTSDVSAFTFAGDGTGYRFSAVIDSAMGSAEGMDLVSNADNYAEFTWTVNGNFYTLTYTDGTSESAILDKETEELYYDGLTYYSSTKLFSKLIGGDLTVLS